ncbi:MAG TPA: sugar ABC transporter substrate-binding protein [bacterium]|nr:sugar ABC transporter substrate-binding protein [bacterium]
MKKVLFLLAVALPILVLGCGKKSGQVLRVGDFMTDPALIQILNDTLKEIEKQNPGLTIQVETTPYNDYQQKIATQMSADNAPDILYVEVNNFVDLYLRNVLEDLSPYVAKDQVDLKAYYAGVVSRFSPGGKLYAVPQDTAPTGLLYYNKKIFKEAGVPFPTEKLSWPDSFLTLCQKLVKKDASGKITRWAYSEAYPISFEQFLYSNGGDWVDDESHPTRFTADSPQALQAARFRFDLIHKYHFSPSTTEMQAFNYGNGVEQMFMNGQIAMMAGGIWHTPKLLQQKDLDFDVVEFPKGPGGKRGWGSGGSGYGICRTSKNKDLAWKVIRAMTSAESLKRLTETGMIQPALIQLAESDTFLKSPGAPNKGILLKMPQYAHYQPFLSNWGEIYYGAFNPAMDRVWLGEKTPEEVLPGLCKDINKKFFNKK